jgi:hypothetical protein
MLSFVATIEDGISLLIYTTGAMVEQRAEQNTVLESEQPTAAAPKTIHTVVVVKVDFDDLSFDSDLDFRIRFPALNWMKTVTGGPAGLRHSN